MQDRGADKSMPGAGPLFLPVVRARVHHTGIQAHHGARRGPAAQPHAVAGVRIAHRRWRQVQGIPHPLLCGPLHRRSASGVCHVHFATHALHTAVAHRTTLSHRQGKPGWICLQLSRRQEAGLQLCSPGIWRLPPPC